MNNTIGTILARVRKQIKALNKDAFVTDRFLYSLIRKHASWLLRREDGQNKLARINHYYQTLYNVELIEVDKIDAGCRGLTSGCTIMRTKETLPGVFIGYNGPLLRTVSSIDGSIYFVETTPAEYVKISSSKSFKYNKTKYYWVINEYLYFPNVDWDAIRVEGLFDGDLSSFDSDQQGGVKARQETIFPIPEYLHAEIEAHVLKDDLLIMYQFPSDPTIDKQNTLR